MKSQREVEDTEAVHDPRRYAGRLTFCEGGCIEVFGGCDGYATSTHGYVARQSALAGGLSLQRHYRGTAEGQAVMVAEPILLLTHPD